MTIKTRGTLAGTGDQIQLKAQFRDAQGNLADLNELPRIQIIQPNNAIYLDYTSGNVYHLETGTYGYTLDVPLNGPVGVWMDNWQGLLGNPAYLLRGSFNFIITNTNLGAPNIDGYVHLGDEPVYNLSQAAIININRLMKILRARLQSTGRTQTTDGYGNIVYQNCSIFSVDELHAFLCATLSEFNNTPHLTAFTWEDSQVADYFGDIIVEGAYIMALASKALIEKGREYNITDNGISYTPPQVADLMNSQFSAMLESYRTRLRALKAVMKPSPLGLGTLRISAVAPQFLRLRHRRERQFI